MAFNGKIPIHTRRLMYLGKLFKISFEKVDYIKTDACMDRKSKKKGGSGIAKFSRLEQALHKNRREGIILMIRICSNPLEKGGGKGVGIICCFRLHTNAESRSQIFICTSSTTAIAAGTASSPIHPDLLLLRISRCVGLLGIHGTR